MSATRRRRRSAANVGRGASGTFGSRNDSNGSAGIAPPFVVPRTERVPGAYQQCLCRVHGAAQMVGDLGDREVVDVPQRQRGAMVRAELLEDRASPGPFELLL